VLLPRTGFARILHPPGAGAPVGNRLIAVKPPKPVTDRRSARSALRAECEISGLVRAPRSPARRWTRRCFGDQSPKPAKRWPVTALQIFAVPARSCMIVLWIGDSRPKARKTKEAKKGCIFARRPPTSSAPPASASPSYKSLHMRTRMNAPAPIPTGLQPSARWGICTPVVKRAFTGQLAW